MEYDDVIGEEGTHTDFARIMKSLTLSCRAMNESELSDDEHMADRAGRIIHLSDSDDGTD